MARAWRIEYEEAYDHLLISSGEFLEACCGVIYFLERSDEIYETEIPSYCPVMSNHFQTI
jgi:hypothetical protein